MQRIIVTVQIKTESECLADAIKEVEELIRDGNASHTEAYPYKITGAEVDA